MNDEIIKDSMKTMKYSFSKRYRCGQNMKYFGDILVNFLYTELILIIIQ